MEREEQKRERIERDTPLTIKLVRWLEGESKQRYGGARTHDLHLWDWEVDALLIALRRMEGRDMPHPVGGCPECAVQPEVD